MSTFVFKNLHRLFDKYSVAHTEHDFPVKSTTKIFSNFMAFSENPNFTYLRNTNNLFMENGSISFVQAGRYLDEEIFGLSSVGADRPLHCLLLLQTCDIL